MLIVQRNTDWDSKNRLTFTILDSHYYTVLKNNSAITNFRLLLIKE